MRAAGVIEVLPEDGVAGFGYIRAGVSAPSHRIRVVYYTQLALGNPGLLSLTGIPNFTPSSHSESTRQSLFAALCRASKQALAMLLDYVEGLDKSSFFIYVRWEAFSLASHSNNRPHKFELPCRSYEIFLRFPLAA
jgi:hypothetical protein